MKTNIRSKKNRRTEEQNRPIHGYDMVDEDIVEDIVPTHGAAP